MKRFLLISSTLAALTTLAWARPPAGETVDPAIAQWYQSLRQPGTQRICCSIADCRPTDLRQSPSDSSHWQAFITKQQFGESAPDNWMDIPDDKIIRHETNPTGKVVICWYMNEIYCAVLPSLT